MDDGTDAAAATGPDQTTPVPAAVPDGAAADAVDPESTGDDAEATPAAAAVAVSDDCAAEEEDSAAVAETGDASFTADGSATTDASATANVSATADASATANVSAAADPGAADPPATDGANADAGTEEEEAIPEVAGGGDAADATASPDATGSHVDADTPAQEGEAPAAGADVGAEPEAAPVPAAAPATAAHAAGGDDDTSSEEPDDSEFPTARRTARDSIHIHRSHLNAAVREKEAREASGASSTAAAAAAAAVAAKTARAAASGGSGAAADDDDAATGLSANGLVVEPTSLVDVVEAVVQEKRRPMPPALPNEVQFEVTYFTPSLGLRLKWQDRRIVVTGSVPPFDAQFADQIAAQPQIDEGDFLTAVGDFHCVGFGAFSDAVALIKSSPRPLTLTFRRNILKKNRAMIVTENVWTHIKKRGMSLLGKVKKYAVEHLGSPSNGHGGVSNVEGGGTVHTLAPAPAGDGSGGGGGGGGGACDHDELSGYDSPVKRPPPMEAQPARPCIVPADSPRSPTGISRTARLRRPPRARIVFADQVGGQLAEVHYSEGLHYSTREQRQSVHGEDGCVIS